MLEGSGQCQSFNSRKTSLNFQKLQATLASLPSASAGVGCQASPLNTSVLLWIPKIGTTASPARGHLPQRRGSESGIFLVLATSSQDFGLCHVDICEADSPLII